MRPTRLEMTGFGSFKETTEVDFEGAEFFALVGPTGSGKSTIIDALCFALYGSVPRLENRALVAPVVSQGKLEAKVRLDFTADGSTYTAIRVVRKSGKGASTKEARLERDGEGIVSGPDELTEAVTKLLGLGFDHFTKCVVLPQGEFARFLHDKPGDRQGLVVKLLNLGIYELMGQVAREREAAKKTEIAGCGQQLEDFGSWATAAHRDELKERSSKLRKLRANVTKRLPRIEELTAVERAADARRTEAQGWIAKLEPVEVPRDIGDLADELASANKLLEESEKLVSAARDKAVAAEKALKKLGDRRPLDRALHAHERRVDATASIEALEAELEKISGGHERAQTALAAAESEEAEARAAQAEAQIEHQAQHLASVLEKGEPCPVCLHEVDKLPKHPAAAGLKAAAKRLEDATKDLTKKRSAADKAARDLAGAEAKLTAARSQVEAIDLDIGEHADRDALTATLEKIDKAQATLDEARSAEGKALDAADEARKASRRVEERQAKARQRFTDARFELAQLGPPPAKNESLVEDWEHLVAWTSERLTGLSKDAKDAAAEAEKARDERVELVDALLESCGECELDVDDETKVLEAVAAADASVGAELRRVEEAIVKAEELRSRVTQLELERETAAQLSLHLSARAGRFPGWIVNAALKRLVAGATEILEQLSQGEYALTTDDNGNFLVIDRNNANEMRSARTLSGGETFLASLSLALALADQLSDLAAQGAARLEAIFLDEGFGTLDPETLDTVAATVENLAASGRMVGIVTHVRELAERVPLQFRVRKDTGSSSIERVIA